MASVYTVQGMLQKEKRSIVCFSKGIFTIFQLCGHIKELTTSLNASGLTIYSPHVLTCTQKCNAFRHYNKYTCMWNIKCRDCQTTEVYWLCKRSLNDRLKTKLLIIQGRNINFTIGTKKIPDLGLTSCKQWCFIYCCKLKLNRFFPDFA